MIATRPFHRCALLCVIAGTMSAQNLIHCTNNVIDGVFNDELSIGGPGMVLDFSCDGPPVAAGAKIPIYQLNVNLATPLASPPGTIFAVFDGKPMDQQNLWDGLNPIAADGSGRAYESINVFAGQQNSLNGFFIRFFLDGGSHKIKVYNVATTGVTSIGQSPRTGTVTIFPAGGGASILSSTFKYNFAPGFTWSWQGGTTSDGAVARNAGLLGINPNNCDPNLPNNFSNGGGAVIAEGFPGAFLTQAQLTGYYNPIKGLGIPAANGSRYVISFKNIQLGTNLYLPTQFAATGFAAALLGADGTPAKQICNTGVAQIPVVNGAASATVEITGRDQSVPGMFSFRVNATTAWAGSPAVPSGTALVSVARDNYAPVLGVELNRIFATSKSRFLKYLCESNCVAARSPSSAWTVGGAGKPAVITATQYGSLDFEYVPLDVNATLDRSRFIGPPATTASLTSESPNRFTTTITTTGPVSVIANSPGTPQSLTITANPAGRAPGTYPFTVNLSATGATVSPNTLTGTVKVDQPAPFAFAGGFGSAANYFPDIVSPGMPFVVFGQGFGPPKITVGTFDSSGKLTTQQDQLSIVFNWVNGTAKAPLIYGVQGQVSGITPFGLSGQTAATFQIADHGLLSAPSNLVVVPASPAGLTQDQSGGNLGAILNQDGSRNSILNPAAPGTVAQFFTVGFGDTNPPGSDGSLTVGTSDVKLPVSLSIGNLPSQVLYAGGAPFLLNGVYQVNGIVTQGPPNCTSRVITQPVVFQVGGSASPPWMTIAVANPEFDKCP